jgi:hypothetical protein
MIFMKMKKTLVDNFEQQHRHLDILAISKNKDVLLVH